MVSWGRAPMTKCRVLEEPKTEQLLDVGHRLYVQRGKNTGVRSDCTRL